jgi:S-formylglutathione hydrolase FrmB
MKTWLANQRVKELILVMPDCHNRLRGSYYTNSVTTGNWADFIAEDLVAYLDGNYRTLSQPESRGIIGHSMGGYGGLKIGMLYPEVFGCMGAMAGAHDLEKKINGIKEIWAHASTIGTWEQFHALLWSSQITIARNAAFTPNPDRPPFYCDSPFIYSDTNPKQVVPNPEVYDRFLEHDILRMIERHLDALTGMRAIYIDCGTNDPEIVDARSVHQRLNHFGVEHIHREFLGDHLCCVMNSTGNALEVFSNAMALETLVGVEMVDKITATWAQIRTGRGNTCDWP